MTTRQALDPAVKPEPQQRRPAKHAELPQKPRNKQRSPDETSKPRDQATSLPRTRRNPRRTRICRRTPITQLRHGLN